jgi:hypothetical protein
MFVMLDCLLTFCRQDVDLQHPWLNSRTEKAFVNLMTDGKLAMINNAVSVAQMSARHNVVGPGSLLSVSAQIGATISGTPYTRTYAGSFSKACSQSDTSNNLPTMCDLMLIHIDSAMKVAQISQPLTPFLERNDHPMTMYQAELVFEQERSARRELKHAEDLRLQTKLRVEQEERHQAEIRAIQASCRNVNRTVAAGQFNNNTLGN